ncbi:tetratricopeptide repeat protein [Rhizorhabdus sp.]|uniref:tetratricopeptide repeat protein n=1 Tax=Rhizorhabdus sp. TaxID=1968843 RepID=UPI0035B40EF4
MSAIETGVSDDDTNGASDGASAEAGADAELIRAELRSVLTSPDFSRAPIMKRLLCFLVEETVAGRGDQLKAYSVAVDGLGRAPDYDARADSYPRVQVGRLRKMLDNHYRTSSGPDDIRLSIPSGRYKVLLERPATSAEEPPEPLPPTQTEHRPSAVSSKLSFGLSLLLILVLVAGLGTAAAILLPLDDPRATNERPVLEVAGTTMARQSPLGARIRTVLINGLGRSLAFDLRPLTLSRASQTPPKNSPPARYRLGADLIDGPSPRLFLRLTQLSPDKLIWSGDVTLPPTERNDAAALDQRLATVIATIGKVDGLIAIHELQRSSGRQAIGYSCLLLYHRYRKQRLPEDRLHVETCIDRSLARTPDDASLQAAAAQLAMEKMSDPGVDAQAKAGYLLAARRHAQLARALDPYNGWTNATQARIALARGSCSQSSSFAQRAIALQPYEPNLLADVGTYLADCRDPDAEAVIRRAIAVGDDPSGRYHVPLLMLAVIRDDRALAGEALSLMAPPVIGRPRGFYIMAAAGYGMLGDRAKAYAAWKQLERLDGAVASAPRSYLDRLGYSLATRRKIARDLAAVDLPPAR